VKKTDTEMTTRSRKTPTPSGQSSLVIVESPSKARTINKYLGQRYTVMASMGHVRDLPPNDLGIAIENGFEPVYEVLNDKRKVVAQLRKAAAKATEVYLATDLDREGEAIAWHLLHALDLDPAAAKRVVFNEITRHAIEQAFQHPHSLDMDKVNAQQARRLLDRIVGYQLSPLLQMKIGRGLSAGRVQSVAARLIVEREREIRAFVPAESWVVSAYLASEVGKADRLRKAWEAFRDSAGEEDRRPSAKVRAAWLAEHACLEAELVRVGDAEFAPKTLDEAVAALESLGFRVERTDRSPHPQYESKGVEQARIEGRLDPDRVRTCRVSDIQKRRTTSKPGAPFTTATLQQAASTFLGLAPSRTMRGAQQLYEGVDLSDGEGPVGLITYMRTDSTSLSRESVEAARSFIREQYGASFLPDKPNTYASAKRAQEAHEAIRPTDVARTPEALKGHLPAPLLKLYDLIWRRFVACQMTPAQWDATTVFVELATDRMAGTFKATGRRLVFEGHLRAMGSSDSKEAVLPPLEMGQDLAALSLEPRQQFTNPPPRYTEASLVKKLESEGIGRPSTYAAVIQTIQDRAYAELIDRSLHPTARGEIVVDKLVEHFPTIMDVKFTSYMEDELDKIEEAHLDWIHVLREFYEPFKTALDRATNEMQAARAQPSPHTCPDCGRPMVYRVGRNGRFLSCSGYPECRHSTNVDAEGRPVAAPVVNEKCPSCGRPLASKNSRHGPFLGCTGYPECNYTAPCDDDGNPLRRVTAEEIEEKCEECGSPMAVKWSRGRSFLGCTGYPGCRATRPLPPGVYVEKPKPEEAGARCDKCGRPMVIRKSRRGPFLSCSGFPRCRNAMPMEKLEELRNMEREGKIPEAPKADAPATRRRSAKLPKTSEGKVDVAALGAPPKGFAWTRTGRPVVEDWPEDGLTCPNCGSEMSLKNGRFGPYWGCNAYPKCDLIANMRGDAKKRAEAEMPTPARPKPIATELRCPECDAPMLIRTGRTGPFLGCSRYPRCKSTQPLPDGESIESLAATGS
jgi:DNA topoisomerase-1